MKKMTLTLLTSLCFASLAGCTSNAIDIDGDDAHARFPGGEVTIALDEVDRSNPKLRYNSVAMGYLRAHGNSVQQIAFGSYADLTGNRIYGPVDLNNQVEMDISYLRFVHHMFVNRHLEWSWAAGMGYTNIDYRGTTPSATLYANDHLPGLHGQVAISYYPVQMLSLEGSMGGYVFTDTFLFSGGHIEMLAAKLGIAVTPVEALRLFIGYRSWGVHMTPLEGESHIDYDLSGPTAVLSINF